jgi:serine phosphatase RsbU (regulator of sigma subunit)
MADSDDRDDTEQTRIVRGAAVAPVVQLGHYLTYTQDDQPRRIRIGPQGVTVGRHPSSTVIFPVPEISRQHCRIELEGDSAAVHDLGSTNGTFVAGHRIQQRTRLQNGSHVTLGNFVLRYEQRDERELEAEQRLSAELRQAVEYVRAILPEPITTGPVQVEWCYVPSSELGGDAFGYQFLDDTTLAGFLLDVSGHGIGAGMHAIAVANVLRRLALPGVDVRDPGQVAAALNTMFRMEDHGDQIFTLWYFVYDTQARTLRFCSAGHHAGFLVTPGAPGPAPVWCRAPAIGMLPPRPWPAGETAIPPGSRLYIFSDGVFEIEQPDGSHWQIDTLRQFISEGVGHNEAQRLYQTVRSAARPGPLADDFSLLVLHFA